MLGRSPVTVDLSILIPSLPERLHLLEGMLTSLEQQARRCGHVQQVELLVLTDNRCRSIGEKRNALLDVAQGRFVAFVDDDDRVAADYVDRLCQAIGTHPDADCVVFDVAVSAPNGGKLARYGVEYEIGEDAFYYYRKPNHLMCYARRIALRHRYRDTSWGEDTDWSIRAARDVVRQVRIPAVLYEYRLRPHPPYRDRARPPIDGSLDPPPARI